MRIDIRFQAPRKVTCYEYESGKAHRVLIVLAIYCAAWTRM